MLSANYNNKTMIAKEKLRDIVKKSVEKVWYNRRLRNPIEDHTELLTEEIYQALSMSGVVGSACSCTTELDRWNCEKECVNKPKIIQS